MAALRHVRCGLTGDACGLQHAGEARALPRVPMLLSTQERLGQALLKTDGNYDQYRRRTNREIAVVILTPVDGQPGSD